MSNLTQYIFKSKYGKCCLNFIFYTNKLGIRRNSNIIKSALTDVEIPKITIPEFVFKNFSQHPDKIAVECSLTGKKFTFEEVRTKSNNLNKSLRKKLQLKKGDVIALLLPNIPEYPICILGALQALLTVTTINPLYTVDEIKRQLVDSNAKSVITLSSLYTVTQQAIQIARLSIPIITIKTLETEELHQNSIDFREFIDTKCDIEDIIPDSCCANETALLPYSSGTTGLPKGVKLSHFNLVSNFCQINHPYLKLICDTTKTHQDVVPGILPWFHLFGMSVVMLEKLSVLCKLVSLPMFNPKLFVTSLVKYKPNLLYIVPPIVILMSNHPDVKKEYLQSIRYIFSGAAPLGATDEEKLLTKIGNNIQILQGYGLSETSPCVLLKSPIRKRQLGIFGSVGEPVPNTLLKVVPKDNPAGEPLGPNKSGELFIKGPQVTCGYLNKPQETKEAFVDGWFGTGDLAHYDENKMFYITDRLKELIKVKGFQVAPAELEEVIRSHPDVLDAAVIGIPHDKYGEVPRAYVVVKPNSNFAVKKLNDYVSDKVATYKQLKGGISVVESILKNNTGKILRRHLREQYVKENK